MRAIQEHDVAEHLRDVALRFLRDRIGRCFALHTGVLTDLHFDQLVIEKRLFDGCDEPVVDAALADVNDRLERMRE